MSDVKTAGNVVWDRKLLPFMVHCVRCLTGAVSSPTISEDKSDYFSLGDALPAFALLTSDEERERKAETCNPGTYHVVVIPGSFSTLPEYADDSAETDTGSSVTNSPTSGTIPESDATSDPNVVILKTFEDTTRRASSTGRTSRVSPTSEISDPFGSLSLSPILANLPSSVKGGDGNMSFLNPYLEQHSHDTALFAHFRHVVWKQLFPHDRSQDESHGLESSGMTLSVDYLEREAAHFPPVGPVSQKKLPHTDIGSSRTPSWLSRL